MIGQATLKEIQNRLDIVEVIGGYLSLKKSGRNFKGLCPFHPEKTPSFMVYAQKQFFICYGCGVGGDLITFVMKHEQMEFQEAVLALAQRAGVTVDSKAGRSLGKAQAELLRAHEIAARFYRGNLTDSAEGQAARNYLKKRGVRETTSEAFCLGYAPDRWDGFLSHTKKENLSPQILEQAGLMIPREGAGGWYDRFRHRVIFPIWDPRGRVIGFGGRALEEGNPAKYMNSPETPLYVKGQVLYGLHLAAPQIRERDFCIVVEGYMDLLTPFQEGIRNVVASMGTSLTPEQVQLIRRMTRHVVMVYDGDYAGQAATLRGLDLFLEAQMRVKVALLPSGTDPDSLIREKGVEAFIRVIRESQDLFDYKLGLLRQQFDPKNLEGQIRICEEMLPTLRRVPNAIERGEYIRRLSQTLGLPEATLWAEFGRGKGTPASRRLREETLPVAASPVTAEEGLAGLLLEDPRRIAFLEGRLEASSLQDPEVQKLVSWLLDQSKEGTLPRDHRDLTSALPRGSSEWEGKMARWLAWADTVEEKERALEEVLERIQKSQKDSYRESLKALIRQAEEAGDEEKAVRLIREYNHLIRPPVAQTHS